MELLLISWLDFGLREEPSCMQMQKQWGAPWDFILSDVEQGNTFRVDDRHLIKILPLLQDSKFQTFFVEFRSVDNLDLTKYLFRQFYPNDRRHRSDRHFSPRI
jgi:hypothetical protein